jgi:hypothetical protein
LPGGEGSTLDARLRPKSPVFTGGIMRRSIRWGFQGIPALGLLLALAGCSDQKSPLGFDQGARGPLVPIPVGITAPDSADLGIFPNRSTGTSLSLLVGNHPAGASPAESRGLIRFGSIPDTTSMRHAYLRLHVKRGEGDTIGVRVHRVLATWDPALVRWGNRPVIDSIDVVGAINGVPTATAPLTTGFQLEDIELPMDLIRRWIALPDSNYGLEIVPTSGSGMARVVSPIDVLTDANLNRIVSPALILATDTTKTATRSAFPTSSAYVIHSLAPPPTGADPFARVGAGPATRLLLRFGLSGLPKGASVVRATLRLPLPSGQVSTDVPLRLLVYEVTESWDESIPRPDTTSLTVRSSYDGLRDFSSSTASVVNIDIGGMVQRWASSDSNHGMSIRLSDETAAPQGLRLYTREDPDSSHHPSLDIVYLPSPDARIGGGAR